MAKRNKLADVQAEIPGTTVARMIIEFQQEFRGTYGNSVLHSNLCAVGPLQAMIGLAIKNGDLYTEEQMRSVEARISS